MIELYLPYGVCLNLFLFICLVFLGWKSWSNPLNHHINIYRLFFLILVLLCVFNYTGDYYHYYKSFIAVSSSGKHYRSHIESIYDYTYQLSFGDYYIWRFIIWGTSIILINKSLKQYTLNKLLYWFILTSYGIIFFTNGRVTLSMSLMYYGLSILIIPTRNQLRRIIGILFIIASIAFHKSAIFGVGCIFLSLICLKLNKTSIATIIFLTPVLIALISTLLSDFLMIDSTGEATDSITSAQGYLNRDNTAYGIGRYIQKYLLWLDFILWGILIIKCINTGYYLVMPYYARILTNLSFIILFISTIFFFDFGLGTRILQLRFAEFAFIPMAYVITYTKQNNLFPKLLNNIIYISIAQTSYNLLYALYLAFNNPIPT